MSERLINYYKLSYIYTFEIYQITNVCSITKSIDDEKSNPSWIVSPKMVLFQVHHSRIFFSFFCLLKPIQVLWHWGYCLKKKKHNGSVVATMQGSRQRPCVRWDSRSKMSFCLSDSKLMILMLNDQIDVSLKWLRLLEILCQFCF